MQNQVFADIEIEDEKIDNYSSVIIRQQFNAHHEFTIRIKYDVLDKTGTFTLTDAQKKMGKMAIIKLVQADSSEVAYEFRGLICEISMEQSDNFTSELVLKGYSPTILLENGPHLLSFYEKGLQQIVQQLTASLSQSNCRVNLKPEHTAQIKYICQYRESTFHFLNRLSSDFGEWFYYDGIDVFFGKPSFSPNIEITYGEDVQNLQLKLRILPLTFNSYSYISKKDELISQDAPSSIDGLDQYASYALQESGKVFSEPVSFPIRQRVEDKAGLEGFVKKQKTAMAADLEVISGRSDNAAICIGALADVKISRPESNLFTKEDYGKFLITSIEHHVSENGSYYNTFEGIPSGIDVIPVKDVILPIAEPQIATVKDNKDPDNMGRVRVQMLWQKDNEMTDWLRVMTPDAGSSDLVSKNRGFVFVPETDDQVLICFRYNDPNRPFVLGSMFNGKIGAGGGEINKTKSLTTRSGSTLTLTDIENAKKHSIHLHTDDGNAIHIDVDAGKGHISIRSTKSISIEAPELISIAASNISIEGKTVKMVGSESVDIESSKIVTINGTIQTNISADIIKVDANDKLTLIGGTVFGMASNKMDLDGGTTVNIKAGTVKVN